LGAGAGALWLVAQFLAPLGGLPCRVFMRPPGLPLPLSGPLLNCRRLEPARAY